MPAGLVGCFLSSSTVCVAVFLDHGEDERRRAAVRYREQLLVALPGSPDHAGWRNGATVDALGHRVGEHGALIRWYRSRGNAWLKPRVTEWAQRLRVKTTAFEVAELGYRWGTTEPSGRVRINWATMQLRPALVEYVIAHELAHLKEAHHGPTFWELLACTARLR
jgi:hypothetical protein